MARGPDSENLMARLRDALEREHTAVAATQTARRRVIDALVAARADHSMAEIAHAITPATGTPALTNQRRRRVAKNLHERLRRAGCVSTLRGSKPAPGTDHGLRRGPRAAHAGAMDRKRIIREETVERRVWYADDEGELGRDIELLGDEDDLDDGDDQDDPYDDKE
jgi:hypothetical protein